MNIGYLVNMRWYPPRGGSMVHAYQVARQLAKRGHNIKTIFNWHVAPNLEVYRQGELFKFLRNIDVLYIRVHGNWGFEHLTLLKILKFFQLPVIWEINSPLEELVARGIRSEKKVCSWNAKRKLLSKFVDAGICVSSVMKEYAVKFLGIKNAHIIPNGSDPDQFNPSKKDNSLYGTHSNSFRVLWSGSAQYPWQGVDIISNVAEKVYSLDRDITFIFITNTKRLKQHNIFEKNVLVLDEKPYLEIAPYIASADAGLGLYKDYGWQGQFYFSPLKIFDYMSSGLPVIATNAGQISEIIQDGRNGFLTDNNIEDVAQKIIDLKNNPDRAQKIGKEARHTIEEFYNWERVAQQTEKILEDLIK